MTQAALGGGDRGCRRSTAAGPASRYPAGTQSGHEFRLKGKGMSVLRATSRGDMYIQATVETPVNLTKRQEELLREFDKAGEEGKTNPESEGFLRAGEGVLRGSARVERRGRISARRSAPNARHGILRRIGVYFAADGGPHCPEKANSPSERFDRRCRAP